MSMEYRKIFRCFLVCCAILFGAMLWCLPENAAAPPVVSHGSRRSAGSAGLTRRKSGVAVDFVRTDCPIANRYAPEIMRLSAKHASDAAFWMVYPDKRESSEEIRKHEVVYHLALPVLRDPQRELMKRAQVSVTPEAAVFDAKGRLVYHGRIDNWFEDFGRARPAPTTHELADAIAAAASGHPATLPSVAAVGCYLSDLQ